MIPCFWEVLLLIYIYFFSFSGKQQVKPLPDSAEQHNEVRPIAGSRELNVAAQPLPFCSSAAEWVHCFGKMTTLTLIFFIHVKVLHRFS